MSAWRVDDLRSIGQVGQRQLTARLGSPRGALALEAALRCRRDPHPVSGTLTIVSGHAERGDWADGAEVRDAAVVAKAERLVTSIDVDEPAHAPRGLLDRQMSIKARLELELGSGRRLLLLDDRGWSSSGPSNIWARTSLKDLADTARTVVGPDEPPDGVSYDEADEGYWIQMAANAETQGVRVEAGALAALPHDVDISEEIRSRIARAAR